MTWSIPPPPAPVHKNAFGAWKNFDPKIGAPANTGNPNRQRVEADLRRWYWVQNSNPMANTAGTQQLKFLCEKRDAYTLINSTAALTNPSTTQICANEMIFLHTKHGQIFWLPQDLSHGSHAHRNADTSERGAQEETRKGQWTRFGSASRLLVQGQRASSGGPTTSLLFVQNLLRLPQQQCLPAWCRASTADWRKGINCCGS